MKMRYKSLALPFKTRTLPDQSQVSISVSGDHAFLSASELQAIAVDPSTLPLERQAALKSRFFLGSKSTVPGSLQLLRSRQAARRETVQSGPALHIIVPTLQCAHSCRYCQVSRSLEDAGHTMSIPDLDSACDGIFESVAPALTIEFQGGDPLLRFDLLQHAIERISKRNQTEQRALRFVVASTLHQLNEKMCDFFKTHKVFLSTSIDGPADLHNKNRPTPTRNAYERTLAGISLARTQLGPDAVSALMTTTRESLSQPEAIVDEYVRLGFQDIFLRPLSSYGFAKRNQAVLGYTLEDFQSFYRRGLERILHWNRQGVALREVYASILLNKMLSTFDAGYVDLQSPTGAGLSVLVYNYDGYVYPSDEARMLAETGDISLRMGRIGQTLTTLHASPVQHDLIRASLVDSMPACRDCAYNQFCAPNPVDAQAQFGTMFAPVAATEHCQRHLWLFDEFFLRLRGADESLRDLFYRWAQPSTSSAAVSQEETVCVV